METDWAKAITICAAVIAILGGVIRYGKGLSAYYRRTLGSQGDLANRLNKLACGVTGQYVNDLFGAPIFQRNLGPEPGYIERICRTPHAWLLLWFSKDDAVQRISITVTDPCFRYETARLTFDQLQVTLGQCRFSCVSRHASGHRLKIAARRGEYAESYYFGNPGHYAFYILSYNMDGRGEFAAEVAVSEGITFWQDGDFGSMVAHASLTPSEKPNLEALRAGTTINTLTVGAALLHPSNMARGWIGVDHDAVRGLRT